MYLMWPHTYESLDNSLALFAGSLEKLKAAQPVDFAEIIDQVTRAAEAARNLRSLVLAENAEASWQNREEFDALVAQIQTSLANRSRILDLMAELERGTIVHRRALRINQMNELRKQAIIELQSKAEIGGEPPALPGPGAEHWVKWACLLNEPEEIDALRALRQEFPHLDTFVANLEPHMWVVDVEAAA